MRWYGVRDGDGHTWEAVFDGGQVTERRTGVGAHETVHQFDDIEAAKAAMITTFRGLEAQGFRFRTHPDDRWRPDAKAATYFDASFLADLRAVRDAPERDPTDYPERLRAYHAAPFPPELEAFLGWRARHEFGYTNFGEWRVWTPDEWLPDPAKGNLFEQVVGLDQQNYLGTSLVEYFAGMVFLGTAGNGDVYLAYLDASDPQRAEVIFWDHESRRPEFAVADGLSTLAFANHLYCQAAAGEVDDDALAADMARIEDRANLPWHYSDLESESGVETRYEKQTNGLYHWYRSYWLVKLLQNDSSMADIGEWFSPDVHAGLKFADALAGPYLRTSNVTALYWLWRLFWFAKSEQLAQCIEALAEHPSPLVRDAVALVRELEGGRKRLGKIDDVHAWRDKFLALDLDPDRAEARAAEAAEAEANKARKDAEDRARAEAFVANNPPESLAEQCWAEVGNPEALKVLYAALREQPAHRDTFARLDFLERGGSSRDGRAYNFEIDEVSEALARTGGVLAPLWITQDDGRLRRVAVAAGARARPLIEPVLDERNDYHHRVVQAVYAMAELGAADVVPKLVEMLDEFVWDDDDYIARIKNKDVVWALCDAIGRLGDARHAPALLKLLAGPKECHVRALLALGQLGGAEAMAALTEALAGEHRRAVLFALGQAGAADAVEAALAVEVSAGVELAYEQVMLQRARLGAGRAIDEAPIKLGATVVESKKYEEIELHETICQLLPHVADREWATQAARLYGHHPDMRVRDAAAAALAELGVAWSPTYADRAVVEARFAAEGLPGLLAWLDDDTVVWRHNVLRMAVDAGGTDDAFAARAVAYARAVPCRFAHYTNGYLQDKPDTTHYVIEALAKLESEVADRYLGELLGHPSPLYRGADVLKYDRDGAKTRCERWVQPAKAEAPAYPVQVSALGEAPWVVGRGINGLAWSPDGARLAVASQGGGVALFDRAGVQVARCPSTANGWIYDVAWHPSGRYLAMGAHAGHLHLLDGADGSLIRKLKGHSGVPTGVRKLRFSPDGTQLASVSDDQTLRVWDVREPTEATNTWTYRDKADINGVDWLDDERIAIITDKKLHFIAVGAAGPEASFNRCGGAEVRVDRDRGRVYATASKGIRVFTRKGKEKTKRRLKQTGVARLWVEGRTLYAASWTGKRMGVHRWDTKTGERTPLKGHGEAAVFGLDVDPTTGEVAAGGKLNVVKRWGAGGALLPTTALFHTDELGGFCRFADRLYSAADDGQVIEWDWTTRRALRSFRRKQGGRCCAVAVTADGARLIESGSDWLAAFDRATGEQLWAVEGGRAEHLSIVGETIVVADYKTLKWVSLDGEVLHQSEPFADSFMFYWAHIDARRLVCAGYDDERVFVWDLEARALLATYALPSTEKGGITDVDCADGRIFVSRWDKTLVVLDAETGAVAARVRLPYALLNLAVNPSGTRVVLGEGECVVFDGETYAELGRFKPPAKLEHSAFVDDRTLLMGAESGGISVATGL